MEPQPLTPLAAPRSLAEDAADRIREQILSGGFTQGEHLVEAKIAEQLAISRGPVREAFKLLRAEGLLNEEPRRGTFVVSLTAGDVREIYGLRAALEGRAARLLARRGDKAAVLQLSALADAIDDAVEQGDAAAVSRADLAFHHGVCEASENARILEVFDRYVPMLRSLLRLDELVVRSLHDLSTQHRPLVHALEAGNEDAADKLFADHAEQAGELIAGVVAANEPAPTG
jgi:GntR family transcriptional regulator of gluconate operon